MGRAGPLNSVPRKVLPVAALARDLCFLPPPQPCHPLTPETSPNCPPFQTSFQAHFCSLRHQKPALLGALRLSRAAPATPCWVLDRTGWCTGCRTGCLKGLRFYGGAFPTVYKKCAQHSQRRSCVQQPSAGGPRPVGVPQQVRRCAAGVGSAVVENDQNAPLFLGQLSVVYLSLIQQRKATCYYSLWPSKPEAAPGSHRRWGPQRSECREKKPLAGGKQLRLLLRSQAERRDSEGG